MKISLSWKNFLIILAGDFGSSTETFKFTTLGILLTVTLSKVIPFLSKRCSEAVVRRCFCKKGVLRNLAKCFPVNFAKFLRTPIFTEHLVTASGCCALETLVRWDDIFCADYTFSVYGTVVECITLIKHTAGNILS